MQLGEKLYRLRREKGWSQEELADQLGVARQTVSKWESDLSLPDLDKAVQMSRLYGVALDELVGLPQIDRSESQTYETDPESVSECEKTRESSTDAQFDKSESRCVRWGAGKVHYEYKSKATLLGVPLLHINIGTGNYRAKGIVAIGNIATGVVSLGFMSFGVLSLGLLSLGLLALGVFAVGLGAAGAFAVGILAAGAMSAGWIALGGVAAGEYAIGGAAWASDIAIGGYAHAKFAFANAGSGEFFYQIGEGIVYTFDDVSEVYNRLSETLSHNVPDVILRMIASAMRCVIPIP